MYGIGLVECSVLIVRVGAEQSLILLQDQELNVIVLQPTLSLKLFSG